MRLTKVSDYPLRVLIYLAVHPDRPAALGQMSRAYGVSSHVLVKAVQPLLEDGLVASVRGRLGGLCLNKAPDQIDVGALLRRTETSWDFVECFNQDTNTCPIQPACGLKGAITRAQRAFLGVFDEYTLAALLPRARELKKLLRVALKRSQPA